MKVVAIIGQKGGTGKTTAAENLAVEAAKQGQTVVLVDLDPQTTAANWGDRREPDLDRRENMNPAVISAQAARLPHVLQAARKGGVTLAIVDTAGRNAEASVAAARGADLVLVPLRPETNDVETLPAVRELLALSGQPHAVVTFTQAPIQGEYEIEMAEVARRHGFLVCPVVLRMRRAYANATWPGQGASEYEPSGKAAQEVRALYKFVCEQVNLKIKRGSHGEEKRHARGA